MNQDIADRLQIILNQKSLSASAFADEIGVVRSSISHIQSRRSKPSLDFIEKMCARFPDIDIAWFISGKAANKVGVKRTEEQTSVQRDLFGAIIKEPQISQGEQVSTKMPITQEIQQVPVIEKIVAEKQIIKIITFFSDNSFQEFIPESKTT